MKHTDLPDMAVRIKMRVVVPCSLLTRITVSFMSTHTLRNKAVLGRIPLRAKALLHIDPRKLHAAPNRLVCAASTGV